MYGVSIQTIFNIASGRSWKYIEAAVVEEYHRYSPSATPTTPELTTTSPPPPTVITPYPKPSIVRESGFSVRMREVFLRALRDSGNLSTACEAANMPLSQLGYYRGRYPEFNRMVSAALQIGLGNALIIMERALINRALHGSPTTRETYEVDDTGDKKLVKVDITTTPPSDRTCLLYTSPSPRD